MLFSEKYKNRSPVHRLGDSESLAKVMRRGYDICDLCNAKFIVKPDDSWVDIFERLEAHAKRRDDHRWNPLKGGWELIDVEEGD